MVFEDLKPGARLRGLDSYAEHEIDAEIVRMLTEDAKFKGSFHRVFAAPDDPASVDETQVLSLVILGPSLPHGGKAAKQSLATDAVGDALLRCRAAQRRFRNTLFFVAADEASLSTARDVTRKAMAWREICDDKRLQEQLTHAQSDDAKEKAKTSREGAARAVRFAWSHILYPAKATEAGKAFDLEALALSSKERAAIPMAVYDKVGPKGDNLAKEKLGPDTFWTYLNPLWPEDRNHLSVTEVAEWFASYAYLPKLRDRIVIESAVREGVGKLAPTFAYADQYDEAGSRYADLVWAKAAPEIMPSTAVIVRADVANAQLQALHAETAVAEAVNRGFSPDDQAGSKPNGTVNAPLEAQKPRRFYGAVEIDMLRPMKAFDSVLNAVVMELQRNPATKVRLTLEIEAEAPNGFDDADVGVVRDNARQLKFKADSTGFDS